MGTSAASEPLSFILIVILYDIWPTYCFLRPFPDFPYRIDPFTDLLNELTKYVIKLAKKNNFCANGLAINHRKGRSKL